MKRTITHAVAATALAASTLALAPGAQAATSQAGSLTCTTGKVVQISSNATGKVYHHFKAPGGRERSVLAQNTGIVLGTNTITSLRSAQWRITVTKATSGIPRDDAELLEIGTGARCI